MNRSRFHGKAPDRNLHVGGGRSLRERVSMAQFPTNSELTANFGNLGPVRGFRGVIPPVISRACSQIPYAAEQGLDLRLAANQSKRAGNARSQ